MVSFSELVEKAKAFVPNAMGLGIGVVTGICFLGVVKLPWNVYFTARETRVELEESVHRGLKVDENDLVDIKSLENRSLFG